MIGSEKIRPDFRKTVIRFGIAAAGAGLLIFGERTQAAARESVRLCLNLIIPSLFPYFIVSTLVLNMGSGSSGGKISDFIMRKLFGIRGNCMPAVLLGLVGGYPVGARTAVTLYQRGGCTKAEAERLLAFCNNSGPAFVLGAVGVGMLGSKTAGLWLYGIHIFSSLVIGIIFRFWKQGKEEKENQKEMKPIRKENEKEQSFISAFIDAVLSAGAGVLRISAFVVVFAVLTEMIFAAGAVGKLAEFLGKWGAGYGLTRETAEALLRGLMEVTSGLWSLSEVSANLTGKMALAACMLGWSGLCVHCQVLSFLQGSGLAVKPYVFGKIMQGILSAGITGIIGRFLPEILETGEVLTGAIAAQAGADGTGTMLTACVGALGVLWVTALTRRSPRNPA